MIKQALCLLLLATGCATVRDSEDIDLAEETQRKQGRDVEHDYVFMGNEYCPFSGRPTDRAQFAVHEGERVYVCCIKCKKRAWGDTRAAWAKAYPTDKNVQIANETCPVGGHEVKEGSSVVFQGREVGLCCNDCIPKFKNSPRKLLAMLLNPELGLLNNPRCPHCGTPVVRDSFFVAGNVVVDTCCSGNPERPVEAEKK